MDSIKCLYDDGPRVVVKKGEILELECDCRCIQIGVYKGVGSNGSDIWVSTDIATGLALVRSNTKERCLEDTKALLMYKGIKSYRNMQKQAQNKFQKIYESYEWACN